MSQTPSSRNPKRQRKKEGAQARRAAELAALRRQQRNRRIVRVALLFGLAVVAVIAVSVLGGDDDDETETATETTTTTAGEETTTTTAAPIPAMPLTCEGPSGENTDMTVKPTVSVPDAPVSELQCQDLVVGDGDEVLNTNDQVQVHYVGVQQSDGAEFDTSWGTEPVTFGLDGVIPGWTEGIPGMKVGGRRVLTIPGAKAYGPQGNPSAGIGPDATLVFIVDLLAVNPTE
jgi:peptidylprolyl isomerase